MSCPFDQVKSEAASKCPYCYDDAYITNEGKGFLSVKYVENKFYVCRARSSNAPPDDRCNTTPCSLEQSKRCLVANRAGRTD